ncbi:MAG: prolyl oligopeptidase family serine peptidase [Candidatus Obscuribacterales bacterium]|nr:prolyl oligopeptidase family serine peptidase [Candidatus Obscuribacterales bacterium]
MNKGNHRSRALSLFSAMLMLSASPGSAMAAQSESSTMESKTDSKKLSYPQAKKMDHVDLYHGKKVEDPYRWLEDPHTEDTRKWIDAENKVTRAFIDSVQLRPKINQRLKELWDYEKYATPFLEGGRLFYFKNSGLQNQDVVYVKDDASKEARVLLDPNQLSKDGTVALAGMDITRDGKYMAYGISRAGSDWQEWYIKDVDTGKDLDEKIEWVKFSNASWTADSKGFFYSRYDRPNEKTKHEDQNYFQKLYFHKIGTKQDQDNLVYERKDEREWGFDGSVSDDGNYLIIHVWKGTEPKNRVFYKDLRKADSPVVELLNKADARYTFIGNEGKKFWLLTDLDAPKSRIVAIDIEKSATTGKPDLTEVLAERNETLEHVSYVGGRFFLKYLKDAYTQIEECTTGGATIRKVELPGIGTANGFGGRSDDKETYYTYTSFNTPPMIYRFDTESSKSELFFKPIVKFDPSRFVTEQVFVESKDGTKVPMFLVHKKGVELNSNNPTYLYGYGGFNIALRPSFSVALVEWMEMGGVFAQACLRGGGEYGEKWHEAGMKKQKQNVFDDFISCGEWLISNKYTSTKKLAIAGASNGGLLVGACMTQRPDLFAAACPTVGVLDMLRFHKFTIGWGWVSDYGSADNSDDFAVLYAYSPLHNVKKGKTYPSTLLITADHDDRVVPAHSFKFAAALQEAHQGENPVLIRIETSAGHGAGKPTNKIIDEWTDKFAFLVNVLDFEKEAEAGLKCNLTN